jgi:hypothetical protein
MVKKLFLLFCIISLNSVILAAEFTASVDRDKIGLHETTNLRLSLVGEVNQEPIDLVKIKEDFDIISSGNYSNIEIINGVSSVTNEWHFILKPKKLGNLIIPTFTIKTATGNISTKTITIKVTKTELLTATKSNNITAISKVNNDNPYLDQPIIYQIQLLTEADVRDVLFDELKLEGMLIKHLGAHKIYNGKYNQRPVTVIELSYLITPTKSGKLVIPPHAIRGFYVVNDDQKNTRVKSLFDSFFDNEPLVTNNNRLVKFELASKEITLNIEPAIKNLVPWLPAESLSLHRTFDNTIFEVGKPITTTIEIKSRGLAKNQLPPLSVDMLKGEGYKVYAENVETNEEIENLSITSSRKEVFTIVPQKAGKLTIPTMEIKWWDVTNKKIKIATIKAQTIDILWNGLKLDPQQAKTPQKQELSEKSNIYKESNHTSVKSTLVGKLINIFDNTKIYYLIISILIIILLASIFRFMTLSNPLKKEKAASGNAVTFAKINTSTNIKLTDTLSPTELYKFLQSYSNVHWQIPLNSSLEKMFALIQEKNPQIKKSDYHYIMKQLQDALYTDCTIDIVILQKECKKFLELAKKKPNIKKHKKTTKLPNLNPL